MYEKDGEKYFVVDGHVHYWDASPENRNRYGEGFINCFYDYHKNLSPEEWVWPKEKYDKYSEEDMMHDLFETGYVDVAIFQPTYLTEFVPHGFNTTEQNAVLKEKYPDKFILNGSFDPREGVQGLEQFEELVDKYDLKGVKLYTAEWKGDSKGWKLSDPSATKYLEKCVELGVKNIHVHKGPTIWPLNRDAFDVADVDEVASEFPDLSFIVEHVGLPRLEDFCWIGTQEPNVYGGLAVAMPWLLDVRYGGARVGTEGGDYAMKAARLHRYDQSIPEDSLKVEEIDEPRIENPLDVIVRIGAAGLCRTDIHVIEGQWQPIQDPDHTLLPYVPGHENAGWVEEIGSAVTNVEVGDTVICHPLMTCGLCRACRAGDDMHCEKGEFPGISRDGGFADLLKTNARAVVKLDPILEPKDIAALADAGLTAYHAVRKSVPLLYAGTKALVIGAGGLGHIGIQCLKALTPTEIIVTDPSEEALELAKEWGADQTVRVEDGYVETVLEMTDGNGAEVVFDYVGERGAQEDAWGMTRQGGSHYVIGYGGMVEVPAIDIISTERNITGNLVGTYNDLVELMVLTAQGKVNLHTSTYPLDAVNDAIQDLNFGNLRGRGILIPEGANAA